MRPFSGKAIGPAFIAAAYFALAGCAVYQPASVQSQPAAKIVISAVEFPAPEPTADHGDNLRSRWAAALGQSFRAKSVTVHSGAPYIADFALSVRDAKSGVADAASTAEHIDWQSPPRSSRFLDECSAKKLRGTLVVFDRASGKIVYRGESESEDCNFDRSALETMAVQIVSDLLN